MPTAPGGMGPGEPTLSHRTGFLPGPAFKLKEKYYDNWQVVAIVDFVKKLCQQKGLCSTARGLGWHKVLPLQSEQRCETLADWFETLAKVTGHTARSARRRSPGTSCRVGCVHHVGLLTKQNLPSTAQSKPLLDGSQKKEKKVFVKTYQEVSFCSAGPSR